MVSAERLWTGGGCCFGENTDDTSGAPVSVYGMVAEHQSRSSNAQVQNSNSLVWLASRRAGHAA